MTTGHYTSHDKIVIINIAWGEHKKHYNNTIR